MNTKREWKPATPNLKVVVAENGKEPRLVISSRNFITGFKPPEYLIDGLLQKRFLYSLTAPTGGGKTALLLLLSALVSQGESVAGRGADPGRVLYLAGENPDDIRMRWMAMADKMDFDIDEIDVYFIEGTFSIRELFDRMALEVEAIGEVALVIVDTSVAFFEGDDENNNVQMQEHALLLRNLTTLPGKPCVVVASHPTKSAGNDRLVPRGGGAFVAAIDGNLVCTKHDSVIDLHWQEKFRGPDFEPIGFQLLTVMSELLKDQKDRFIPTVIAKPLTERVRTDLEQVVRRDEDALLVLMAEAPGGTQESMGRALGWFDSNGTPQRYRVSRVFQRLERAKLVNRERDGYELTGKGKEAAKKAK